MTLIRVATIALIVALSASALGNPIRTRSPAIVRTEAGSEFAIPPSVIMSPELWDRLDVEIRRLQETETRLRAENKSLRGSRVATPGKGTFTALAAALVLGIALGVAVF